MEKNQLLYVLETSRTGNITKAAEGLHITQPSLSNQIIKLEEELGIKLFERRRKRVVTTEAGDVFCRKAEEILRGFDELKEIMQNYADRKAGSLRVGVLSIMLPLGLLDKIDGFSKENPFIDLSITEKASYDLLEMLRQNLLDAAIVTLPASFRDEHIKHLLIDHDEICAVINKENPLAARTSLKISDLSGQNLILNTENYSLQNQIRMVLDEKGVDYRVAMRCDQIESGIALSAKNYGICFASKSTVEYYGFSNVTAIPMKDIPARGIYATHIKDPEYYPVMKSFLNYIFR